MSLDAEKLEELKSNIAFARKRPLAFGLCLGKAAETTVLLAHKTKDPETVGRQAKKEGETTKLVFGMMTVEGKNLNLSCHVDALPGLARRTREMLKVAGLKMKVRVLDAEGNLLEENGDPDEEGASEDLAGPADPQQDRWKETRARVEAALERAAADGRAVLSAARATWETALASAGEGDFPAALNAAAAAARQIAAAVEAVRLAEADRSRWLSAADKLQPVIDRLAEAATPEARKLSAVWSLARSKATGSTPDFATALKALPMVVKLIGEIKALTEGASGAGPQPGSRVAGPPPVTAQENARLMSLTDDALVATDLTGGSTRALFGEDYMRSLKDVPIRGVGNGNLKSLMREIDKGLDKDRRPQVMTELAAIVGVPPTAERLGDDYDRFLILRRQQMLNQQRNKKDPVPGLDEGMHPDFLASRSQLVFGKILGDAFGIHEVFAAMLSPTGGLVGPGNWLIEPGKMGSKDGVKAGHLDPDNPVALHGTVHDAAGYLGNYHGEGPGYNYRNSSIEFLGTDDPLSGQISGIAYWVKEVGVEFALRKAGDAASEVEKQLKPYVDKAAAEIDQKVAQAQQVAKQGQKEAQRLVKQAERSLVSVGEAIVQAADSLQRSAEESFDAGRNRLGRMRDDARQALQAAWDFVWN